MKFIPPVGIYKSSVLMMSVIQIINKAFYRNRCGFLFSQSKTDTVICRNIKFLSVDRVKLMVALDTYIFKDGTMKENTGNDIVRRLKITFSDKGYIGRLDRSAKRWIDEEISVVTNGLFEFVAKI